MNSYVLGIDGGGTKTHCVILDRAGRLCGYGKGGISNYDDVGVAAAREQIGLAVMRARTMAGLDEAPFAAAFLGMAGVVAPHDRAAIHGIAQDLKLALPEHTGVDHDCRVALAGGLSGRPGIVQIAGTGSACYGRNAAGQDWRAGGWGHLIADEGSGYWLGVQAMQAAVRAYDGRGEPTLLLDAVRERLNLADLNDIMHRLYVAGTSRSEIAALAPLVFDAARADDRLAHTFLARAAEELADCVLAVAQRLGIADESCELALVGGLFQTDGLLEQPLRTVVERRVPGCRVARAELPPAVGAALLALEIAGVTPEPATLETLRNAATQTSSV
jgi:N-acetylglucosamine kinase